MTSKPIRVDGSRLISAPVAVALLVLSATVTATLAYAAFKSDIDAAKETATQASLVGESNGRQIRDLERKYDKDVSEIHTNIRWIRDELVIQRRASKQGSVDRDGR